MQPCGCVKCALWRVKGKTSFFVKCNESVALWKYYNNALQSIAIHDGVAVNSLNVSENSR